MRAVMTLLMVSANKARRPPEIMGERGRHITGRVAPWLQSKMHRGLSLGSDRGGGIDAGGEEASRLGSNPRRRRGPRRRDGDYADSAGGGGLNESEAGDYSLDVNTLPSRAGRRWRKQEASIRPGVRSALMALPGGLGAAREARLLVAEVLATGSSKKRRSVWGGRGATSVLWAAAVAALLSGRGDARGRATAQMVLRTGRSVDGVSGVSGVSSLVRRSMQAAPVLSGRRSPAAMAALDRRTDAREARSFRQPVLRFGLAGGRGGGGSGGSEGIRTLSPFGGSRRLCTSSSSSAASSALEGALTATLDPVLSSQPTALRATSSLQNQAAPSAPPSSSLRSDLFCLMSDLASGADDLGPRELAMALWALQRIICGRGSHQALSSKFRSRSASASRSVRGSVDPEAQDLVLGLVRTLILR